MIRICLLGVGNMGGVHFQRYIQLMQEGKPVKLVAIFDLDIQHMQDVLAKTQDFAEQIHWYDDFDRMMECEVPDAVDIALPDNLHCEYTIRAMQAGAHVICEKPMAMNNVEAAQMLEASQTFGRQLMIAHCCRFMQPYVQLKKLVDSGDMGQAKMASFYRMSSTPTWSYDNWLLNRETSAGCLLDMHIHDIDMLQWLFGKPQALCATGHNLIPGSGVDELIVQYKYPNLIACAQSSWCIRGDNVPFMYGYQVAFEKGSIFCQDGVMTIYREGRPPEVILNDSGVTDGYYREIEYFVQRLHDHQPIIEAAGSNSAIAVHLAQLENESIQKGGIWIAVQ